MSIDGFFKVYPADLASYANLLSQPGVPKLKFIFSIFFEKPLNIQQSCEDESP